jgi:hypothetical protein
MEYWLALAENNVDSTAYRPDDVLTTVTGNTIECVHTDAEGRLLLADTLALASRQVTPSLMYGSSGSSGGDCAGADLRGDGSGSDAQRAVVVDPASLLPPHLLVDFATLTGIVAPSCTIPLDTILHYFDFRSELRDSAVRPLHGRVQQSRLRADDYGCW